MTAGKSTGKFADDLECRLTDFAVATCRMVRRLPDDIVGHRLRVQLVKSATSPAANYAEARSAESRRDFIHKLQLCAKELRECMIWLRIAQGTDAHVESVEALHRECRELTAILVRSITTARGRMTSDK